MWHASLLFPFFLKCLGGVYVERLPFLLLFGLLLNNLLLFIVMSKQIKSHTLTLFSGTQRQQLLLDNYCQTSTAWKPAQQKYRRNLYMSLDMIHKTAIRHHLLCVLFKARQFWRPSHQKDLVSDLCVIGVRFQLDGGLGNVDMRPSDTKRCWKQHKLTQVITNRITGGRWHSSAVVAAKCCRCREHVCSCIYRFAASANVKSATTPQRLQLQKLQSFL